MGGGAVTIGSTVGPVSVAHEKGFVQFPARTKPEVGTERRSR